MGEEGFWSVEDDLCSCARDEGSECFKFNGWDMILRTWWAQACIFYGLMLFDLGFWSMGVYSRRLGGIMIPYFLFSYKLTVIGLKKEAILLCKCKCHSLSTPHLNRPGRPSW